MSINAVKPMMDEGIVDRMMGKLGAVHPKYKIMLHLGVYTGLRVSDILGIRARDVKTSPLIVQEKKTGKIRVIAFESKLGALFECYVQSEGLRPGDYLIYSCGTRKDKALSRVQAWRVMRRVGLEMGVEGIGTHSMRKTYAREHFGTYGSVEALQREFGHKYVWTTMGYLVDQKDVAKVIEKALGVVGVWK
jgi:integrase